MGTTQFGLKKTPVLLKDPDCPPIFEATLENEGVFFQFDILIPEKVGLAIIEIKTSKKLKKLTKSLYIEFVYVLF